MIFCHSQGVPTDWKWWFFVTHGGSQLTFEMFIWPNLSFQIRNKLLPTWSLSSTVKTSTSFELAYADARVTSIKSTKRYWVSQLVSDKGSQWSDMGPIKIMTDFMPWEPKSSFHRGWFFSLANGVVLVRSLEYHILTQLQDLNHPKVREHQRIEENNFREQQLSFTIIYHPQFAGIGQLVIVLLHRLLWGFFCFRRHDGQGKEEAEEGFHSKTNFRVWGEVPGLKKTRTKYLSIGGCPDTIFQEKKYLTSLEMATLAYSSGATHQQVFSLPEPPFHTW